LGGQFAASVVEQDGISTVEIAARGVFEVGRGAIQNRQVEIGAKELEDAVGFEDGVWGLVEFLTEALHGYTAGGAYAGFDEHRLGRIAPGMQADIVVMDRDLEALASEEIDTARAALTLCGGEITWEA